MSPRPVLLVEDDPDLCAMIKLSLEMDGIDVVTAANGMEAYNTARAHQPALILLDLMMPVMTGEEFRNAQLANAEIRRIPVVVVSARHDAPQVAKRMKAAACFRKPLDLDVLAAMCKKMMR